MQSTGNLVRRASFQIHLSTAIVLMFVAGGLIWANTIPQVDQLMPLMFPGAGYAPEVYYSRTYGWPLVSCEYILKSPDKLDNSRPCVWKLNTAIDMVVAASLLLAAGFICEWLIRRRHARKEA